MSWQSEQRWESLLRQELSGAQLIAEERNRQRRPRDERDGEGYREDHDRDRADELALAAACYTIPPKMGFQRSKFWPWHRNYWKPKGRLEDLVRAGALIAAAIDEIKRQEKEKNARTTV